MTISIGMICRQSIVLACDSLTTYRESNVKDGDAEKMWEFDLGGISVVAVMSDSLDNFDHFIDKMEQIAERTEVKNLHSIPDAFRRAVKEMKIDARRCLIPAKKGKALERHFLDRNFQLVFAAFYEGMPYLWAMDYVFGEPQKINQGHAMTGSPLALVKYLFDGLPERSLKTVEGMAMSAYVIAAAKNHDKTCGGITRIAVLYPDTTWILAQDEIAPFDAAAGRLEFTKQKQWLKILKDGLPAKLEKHYEWQYRQAHSG